MPKGGIDARKRRDPNKRFEAARRQREEKRRLRAKAGRDLHDANRQGGANGAPAGEDGSGGKGRPAWGGRAF